MTELTMKPFNLEEALAGAKVITRDKYEVTQLMKFDCPMEIYPVVGVVAGRVKRWTTSGAYDKSADYHSMDIFMYEDPIEVWEPTMELRLVDDTHEIVRHKSSSYGVIQIKETQSTKTLQQKWFNGDRSEWRDIPTVREEEQ